MSTVPVQSADLEKILDVVKVALRHHEYKDRMNATTHMTPVRFSPLTTNLKLATERLEALIAGMRDHEGEESTDGNEDPEVEGSSGGGQEAGGDT